MAARQPKYNKEEHARRGTELYEQQVRSRVGSGNDGRIVAIDIDSSAFEVAENTLEASKRLLARCPDAQIWCVRIGHRAVHHFVRSLHVYAATVVWDGQQRDVETEAVEAVPLIGMRMLHRTDVRIRVKDGGIVTITCLP